MQVGTVCYATSQGLGHLAKSFYDAGVINKVMIYRHPNGEAKSPTHTEWYPQGTMVLKSANFSDRGIDQFLSDIDVMLFFETPFDWSFANKCHKRGIKTALVPMYEWFPIHAPHRFDLFLNPSALDQRFFPSGTHIPVPVEDFINWNLRTTAKRFLHNAGHIGSRNHKGTLELLRAVKYVKSPFELTVRCQNVQGLNNLVRDAGVGGDSRIKLVYGEIPREELFSSEYDVYIAPEKYNGLSLPLQEAFASGMMVMASNRFPNTEWLPDASLIPVDDTQTAQTMRGHLDFQEAIITPEAIAAHIDSWYGKDISEFSRAGLLYKHANSWEVLKPLYMQALERLIS